MYEGLICYRANDGITISQFIPSQVAFGAPGHQWRITLKADLTAAQSSFSNPANTTGLVVDLAITCEESSRWTLRIRQPKWAIGPGTVAVDGNPVPTSVSKDGFIEIVRDWRNEHVTVTFAKRITREPLPGDDRRFALLDGPVVLAALGDGEPELGDDAAITPQYEHQYIDGREWQSGHFLARTHRGSVPVMPLYEIADQPYSVYFSRPQ